MGERIKHFYDEFISAMYGFLVVIGFSRFVDLASEGPAMYSNILFITTLVTVLHFWLVFVASCGDALALIDLSSDSRSSGRSMAKFWVELLFATIIVFPVQLMFFNLTDIVTFSLALTLAIVWSTLWEVYGYYLERSSKKSGRTRTGSRVLIKRVSGYVARWAVLDICYLVIITVLTELAWKGYFLGLEEYFAMLLLSLMIVSSILDTIILNPKLYWKGKI